MCSVKLVVAATIKVDTDKIDRKSDLIKGFEADLSHSSNINDPFCNRLFEIIPGVDQNGSYLDLILKDFPKGSIIILEKTMDASAEIRSLQENLSVLYPSSDWIKSAIIPIGIKECMADLDFVGLNILLYRSDPEERNFTGGHGVYNIPGNGNLSFCGLQGFVSILGKISMENNLGHPLCQNLREGFWQLDYVIHRLQR